MPPFNVLKLGGHSLIRIVLLVRLLTRILSDYIKVEIQYYRMLLNQLLHQLQLHQLVHQLQPPQLVLQLQLTHQLQLHHLLLLNQFMDLVVLTIII